MIRKLSIAVAFIALYGAWMTGGAFAESAKPTLKAYAVLWQGDTNASWNDGDVACGYDRKTAAKYMKAVLGDGRVGKRLPSYDRGCKSAYAAYLKYSE
ncbi:hypothetical protein ACIBG8_19435 [Nonomuraea sp. NPDC050556]|uniref:hypothetical protein n=1 Tax=Nonomuraea sp. NPDC050556 TaxID=3364369 RepID=UPI0037BD6E51